MIAQQDGNEHFPDWHPSNLINWIVSVWAVKEMSSMIDLGCVHTGENVLKWTSIQSGVHGTSQGSCSLLTIISIS